MKHPFRSHILPVFPAVAGALGLLLRFWLFSATDEKGLLPATHIADTLLYILTAVTLGFLFLATRELTPRPVRKGFFGIPGCVMCAIGLLCSGISLFFGSAQRFSGLAAIACIAGGLILLVMAARKFFHKRIPYGFFAVLTACLMLDTIASCQIWGTVSQLQEYFFPLMASVFLILSTYHATLLAAGQGKPKLLAFFSQGALFFCCVCLNTARWPLYLGMLFWAASQLYSCIRKQKEG